MIEGNRDRILLNDKVHRCKAEDGAVSKGRKSEAESKYDNGFNKKTDKLGINKNSTRPI